MSKTFPFIITIVLAFSCVSTIYGSNEAEGNTLAIELINPPKDTTVNCQNFKPSPDPIEVVDECPGDVAMSYFETSTRTNEVSSCSYYNYVVTRVFTFTNDCDEVVNYTQTITVIDTTSPVFFQPPDVTVSCDEINNLEITGSIPNVLDNCGAPTISTYSDSPIENSCNATFERTWTLMDPCGNTTSKIQRIMVLDTTPPFYRIPPQTKNIFCAFDDNPYPEFNIWVNSFGGSVVSEECNDIAYRFAAVPGSYDSSDPMTYPGIHPGVFNDPDCSVNEGYSQYETVDFVVVDKCGNVNVQSATFYYRDDKAPQIGSCGGMVTVMLPADQCDTTLTFNIPSYNDICGGGDIQVSISDTVNILSGDPDSTMLTVMDLHFQLSGFGPEIEFDTNTFFEVTFHNIDANDPGEVFTIYDEDGNEIGETPNIGNGNECGSINFQLGPFSDTTMYEWSADGTVQFDFITKINESNPENTINYVCEDSYISIEQSFTIERPEFETELLLSIDDKEPIKVDGITVSSAFSAGEHSVKFIARDCAGNETTCSRTVRIMDELGPTINCNGNMMIESQGMFCEYPVRLGDLFDISEECGEENMIEFRVIGAMFYNIEKSYEDIQDDTIFFPIGTSNITITAFDFSGNSDQCEFDLNVRDVQAPDAICELIDVPVVAVELDQFKVDASILAPLSSDNCGVNTIVIQGNTYNCSDLDNTVGRNIIVSDNSGNSSSCVANIHFSEMDVPITYSAGICPNDSLKFFLNITQFPTYSYQWSGPFGFTSVEPEPFVADVQPNHEGLYSLTITNNNTGCISTGSVQVDILDVRIPTFQTDSVGCETLPHKLISSKIPGKNIKYNWYENVDGIGDIITVSDTNVIDVFLPPGNREIYLRVSNNKCTSLSSNFIEVDIRPKPIAVMCNLIEQACIGDPLTLCVQNAQSDWSFNWFGPNGFTSNEPMPEVTESYSADLAGVYSLVVESNECIGDTLTTAVINNQKPPKPTIIGGTNYCAGDTLVLASSLISNQYVYVWHSPIGQFRTSEPILRIPNLNSNYSGDWCLLIESGPCLSIPSDTINVFVEENLNFAINEIPTQCNGTEIRLLPTVVPNSSYSWEGPGGFTSNFISPLTVAETGTYSVSVLTNNGCLYEDEIDVLTVNRPNILGVTPNKPGPCLEREEGVFISASVNQSQGLSYNWQGPGVQSTSPVLSLENYSPFNNGEYTLEVSNGDCTSTPFNFELDYILRPVTPIITANPIACIGDSLVIISSSYNAGTTYHWTTPNGIIETSENRLVIQNVSSQNQGNYSLVVEDAFCNSVASDGITVIVNENDFTPEILSFDDQCVENDISLFTNLDSELPLEWELPNGNILFTDTLEIVNAQPSVTGEYRVRSYFNDCPSEWSQPFTIIIEDPRIDVSLQTDYLFSCNHETANLELCLDDESELTGKVFQWYTQGELLGETNSPCFPINDFSPFEFGVNQVEIRIRYNNCLLQLDEILFLEIENVRDIQLSAGPDQTFCLNQELIMDADEPQSDKLYAYWTFDQKLTVDDIEDPMTTVVVVDDIPSSPMIWNVEHEVCGTIIMDTMLLIQKSRPQAFPDTVETDNAQIIIPVTENDSLLDNTLYDITNIEDPIWGEVQRGGTVLTYESDASFVGGPVYFQYEICDTECPNLCDLGEVLVLYKQNSCRGNNVLTPNNDGVNDRFVIPCLDESFHPDNELVVLNELGNKVFEQAPYDNSWAGTFNGEILPEGTYYYIFRQDGNSSVIQGFISIER